MKYLKKFEASYATENTIMYIRDIFIEIEDDNYNVDINAIRNVSTNNIYKISLSIKKNSFKLIDILDYILSARDYMDMIGYKTRSCEVLLANKREYNISKIISDYDDLDKSDTLLPVYKSAWTPFKDEIRIDKMLNSEAVEVQFSFKRIISK